MTDRAGSISLDVLSKDGAYVPTKVETWPSIEHEPEHMPAVPPDLRGENQLPGGA